ncbi:hypothetical protein GUJ93_ZPchr0012g21176 [Zizania palustris]|uniref:Uncharacterized protein n=1 Tax=Zizania palustris TaxID=103762 RepID=A0A8J6BVW0_ZIZPA|nr:hypothetical protein GUJ93_ZPchr0012g21176 [Zizania palustris]
MVSLSQPRIPSLLTSPNLPCALTLLPTTTAALPVASVPPASARLAPLALRRLRPTGLRRLCPPKPRRPTPTPLASPRQPNPHNQWPRDDHSLIVPSLARSPSLKCHNTDPPRRGCLIPCALCLCSS